YQDNQDENNGWGHFHYTSTNQILTSWGTDNRQGAGGVGSYSDACAAFKSATATASNRTGNQWKLEMFGGEWAANIKEWNKGVFEVAQRDTLGNDVRQRCASRRSVTRRFGREIHHVTVANSKAYLEV